MTSRLALALLVAACGGARTPEPAHHPDEPHAPLDARDVEQLVISPTGSCGVFADHRIACWGGWDGALIKVAAPAAGLHEVAELAIGHELLTDPQAHYDHLCARDRAGAVRCWGNNQQGQLGTGDRTDSMEPTVVAALGTSAQLALGQRHACALDRGGAVRCWGSNEFGQLGVGRGADAIATPTPVALPDGTIVEQLVATVDSTCARTRDHRVLCWGDNQNGQAAVRDGAIESSIWTPRELVLGRGARALAAAESTVCAIVDGAIACWGYTAGVLDGSHARVEGIDDAQAIALGTDHGCALRSGGAVWCFGMNVHGELGNDRVGATRSPPAQVTLPGPATQIVAGGWNTCARLADRRWFCWGANLHGELGPREATPQSAAGAPATGPVPHPTPTPLDLTRVELVAE